MKKKTAEKILALGNLQQKDKNVFGGTVNGYHTVITYYQQFFIINVNAVASNPDDEAVLRRNLLTIKSQVKNITTIEYEAGKVHIQARPTNLEKNLPEKIGEILSLLTNVLTTYQFEDCCGVCGQKDQELSLSMINGNAMYMCNKCYDEVEGALQQNKVAIKQKKGNMITGIVGALLGSLIGVAAWVLIGQLGYIAGIAGLIITVCAIKGYELLGGKLNAIGLTVCLVIVAGMVFFAHMTSTALIIYQKVSVYHVSFFEVYQKIPDVIDTNPELYRAFYGDLAIGYILTIIASVSTVVSIYKSNSGSFKMKKLG